jgi:hypothetical protein
MTTLAELMAEIGCPQNEEEMIVAADSVAAWLIASGLSDEAQVAMLDRVRTELVQGWLSDGDTSREVAQAEAQTWVCWVVYLLIKARMAQRRH